MPTTVTNKVTDQGTNQVISHYFSNAQWQVFSEENEKRIFRILIDTENYFEKLTFKILQNSRRLLHLSEDLLFILK